MLIKEGGLEILKQVEQDNNDEETHTDVKRLCQAILDTLAFHSAC